MYFRDKYLVQWGKQHFLEWHLRQALSFPCNKVTSWQLLHKKVGKEKWRDWQGRKPSQIPQTWQKALLGGAQHYMCHDTWQRRFPSSHPPPLHQQPLPRPERTLPHRCPSHSPHTFPQPSRPFVLRSPDEPGSSSLSGQQSTIRQLLPGGFSCSSSPQCLWQLFLLFSAQGFSCVGTDCGLYCSRLDPTLLFRNNPPGACHKALLIAYH